MTTHIGLTLINLQTLVIFISMNPLICVFRIWKTLTFAIGFPLGCFLFAGWRSFFSDLYILFLSVSASGWISLLFTYTHTHVYNISALCKRRMSAVWFGDRPYSSCGWSRFVLISFLSVCIYILSLIFHPLPEITSGPLGWPTHTHNNKGLCLHAIGLLNTFKIYLIILVTIYMILTQMAPMCVYSPRSTFFVTDKNSLFFF